MKHPNISEEKKLWKKGYKCVVGLDEAGRGPLAGPVVAAAVCANFQFPISNFQSKPNFLISKKVKDSKQLSAKKRKELYDIITTYSNIEWGVGIVSEKVIDRVNILEATKVAMKKAIRDANIPIHTNNTNKKIDFILIDGNFKLDIDIPQKSIIRGDQKVFSISAASIIAKVTRDRIMQKYHRKYPEYGFISHKGYPTKAHFTSLQKFGPCRIHRKTFNLKLSEPQRVYPAFTQRLF